MIMEEKGFDLSIEFILNLLYTRSDERHLPKIIPAFVMRKYGGFTNKNLSYPWKV